MNITSRKFTVSNSALHYKKTNIHSLASKYGTPLRAHAVETLTENFNFIKSVSKQALRDIELPNNLYECGYAIKANQSYKLVRQAAQEFDFIETTSVNDLILIERLTDELKNKKIVCNGFKPENSAYINKIVELRKKGLNIIPVIDSMGEFTALERTGVEFDIGIRFETQYENRGKVTTERFGISLAEFGDNLKLFKETESLNVCMLHMHTSGTIKDIENRLASQSNLFNALKLCIDNSIQIEYLNFGGGFPVRNNTNDEFYAEYINQLLGSVKRHTEGAGVLPKILNEPGRFFAAETQFIILEVLDTKQNNKDFSWSILDGSSINLIPEVFLDENMEIKIYPSNESNKETAHTIFTGITCDPEDIFNRTPIPFPKKSVDETLFVVIPNTGAYQESLLGSQRGLPGHCLIPGPIDVYLSNNSVTETTKHNDNFVAGLGFPKKII